MPRSAISQKSTLAILGLIDLSNYPTNSYIPEATNLLSEALSTNDFARASTFIGN